MKSKNSIEVINQLESEKNRNNGQDATLESIQKVIGLLCGDVSPDMITPEDILDNLYVGGGNFLLNKHFPVGSIYIPTNSTNPESYWGGTGVAWGSGKVPVGIDTSDTDFNTVEKEGGIKTHNHTSAAHSHSTRGHALTAEENGPHTHTVRTDIIHQDGQVVTGEYLAGVSLAAGTARRRYNNICGSSGSGTEHSHGDTEETTPGNTGDSLNLPPYITCYMWKRLA